VGPFSVPGFGVKFTSQKWGRNCVPQLSGDTVWSPLLGLIFGTDFGDQEGAQNEGHHATPSCSPADGLVSSAETCSSLDKAPLDRQICMTTCLSPRTAPTGSRRRSFRRQGRGVVLGRLPGETCSHPSLRDLRCRHARTQHNAPRRQICSHVNTSVCVCW
jgi:hypothetical protein